MGHTGPRSFETRAIFSLVLPPFPRMNAASASEIVMRSEPTSPPPLPTGDLDRLTTALNRLSTDAERLRESRPRDRDFDRDAERDLQRRSQTIKNARGRAMRWRATACTLIYARPTAICASVTAMRCGCET